MTDSESPNTRQRDRLEAQRRQATRDIAELESQLGAGEIDQATADRLRTAYEAELAGVSAILDTFPAPETESTPVAAKAEPQVEEPAGKARSIRGIWIGAAGLMAVMTVVILWAAGGIGGSNDAAGGDEPGAQAFLGSDGDLTLAEASISDLEAALIETPEINPLRLELADRYLEEGERRAALEQYLIVAANEPTPEEEGRALTRVGYLAYVTGQHDAAVTYLQDAMSADPTNGEAELFMGLTLLYGLGDTEGAIPYLESVRSFPDLPEDIRTTVDDALADARAGG